MIKTPEKVPSGRNDVSSRPSRDRSVPPLWLFFVACLVSSWLIWLWPVDPRRLVYLILFGVRIQARAKYLKLLIGNCLPGVIAVGFAAIGGRTELGLVRSTLAHWRVPARWYFLAAALPSSQLLTALCLVLFFTASEAQWPPITGRLKIFFSACRLEHCGKRLRGVHMRSESFSPNIRT